MSIVNSWAADKYGDYTKCNPCGLHLIAHAPHSHEERHGAVRLGPAFDQIIYYYYVNAGVGVRSSSIIVGEHLVTPKNLSAVTALDYLAQIENDSASDLRRHVQFLNELPRLRAFVVDHHNLLFSFDFLPVEAK